MLKDAGLYCIAFALPTQTGNFGFAGNYFGSAVYNEMRWQLAYGRRLGKVDAGVGFNYCMFKTAGYGKSSAVNFEAGFIFHMTEQLQIGAHVYNPVSLKNDKSNQERMPLVYSSGLGYDVSKEFFLGAKVEKTEDLPLNVVVGLEYAFDKKLIARAGISTATSSFYFGTGVLLDHLRIDITASIHPQLGVTPGLMMVYNSPLKQ